MLKLLKIFGHLIKAVAILLLITTLLAVIAFYFMGRNVPAPLLRHIEQRLAGDDYLVRIERATFSLTQGLRCYNVGLLPKKIVAGATARVDQLTLRFLLTPNPRNCLQSVTLRNLNLPALPAKQPVSQPPKAINLPELAPFQLFITNADVLGIQAEALSAMIKVMPAQIEVRDLKLRLVSERDDLNIHGQVSFNPATERLHGEVIGQTYPENLLPLFEVLQAHGAIRQISAFTDFAHPVKAHYTFHVETDTTDFDMLLKLELGPCRYHGVPMAFARGDLGIYGTNIYTSVAVKNLNAETRDGAPLRGDLRYYEESESLAINAQTTMMPQPLFEIIGILNQGELDKVVCHNPPSIKTQGEVALSLTKSTVTNLLTGQVHLPAGTILNFAANDLSADFTLAHHQFRFENLKAPSPCGGHYSGRVTFDFPDYAAAATVHHTDLNLSKISLEQISAAFNVTNSRAGLVSGNIVLTGPVDDDSTAHLSGRGKLEITDGVINQMRLFAGLTAYLSRNVPGISSLVNQSSGSMDFTIKDGVLKTDNLLLEGDIFSLRGRGTYDINRDKLDFVIRANFFKSKSIIGKITHFVTFPFTRLLLEFKVFGSLDDPDWSYVNIIEKVTDTFTSESKKP